MARGHKRLTVNESFSQLRYKRIIRLSALTSAGPSPPPISAASGASSSVSWTKAALEPRLLRYRARPPRVRFHPRARRRKPHFSRCHRPSGISSSSSRGQMLAAAQLTQLEAFTDDSEFCALSFHRQLFVCF